MANRSENQSLFNPETPAKPQGPVECLGMTFNLTVSKKMLDSSLS